MVYDYQNRKAFNIIEYIYNIGKYLFVSVAYRTEQEKGKIEDVNRGVTSPFCLGGCLLELPCETDDALQQKFFFVNIFPKKVSGGGGGGGVRTKKIFPDIQKKKPKKFFFGQKPVN